MCQKENKLHCHGHDIHLPDIMTPTPAPFNHQPLLQPVRSSQLWLQNLQVIVPLFVCQSPCRRVCLPSPWQQIFTIRTHRQAANDAMYFLHALNNHRIVCFLGKSYFYFAGATTKRLQIFICRRFEQSAYAATRG